MVSPVELGRRIADLRKVRGLTQEELGTKLGITGQAISKWENGDSMPDVALIPDRARLLGISADGLLSGAVSIPHELILAQLQAVLHNQDYAARFRWMWDVWHLLFQAVGATREQGGPAQLNEVNTVFTYAGSAVLDTKGFGAMLTPEYLDVLYSVEMDDVAPFFRVLADEINLRILLHLRPGVLRKVEDLQQPLAVSAEDVRSHLLTLSEAGFIEGSPNGYRLSGLMGVLVYMALSLAAEYASIGKKTGHSEFFNWNQ